ncbi:unnamed protein product [Peniophora sp. CBMAI 1063]|nr:unnamed protein product [Peniophora sp. CBMAI 1063]
MLLMLVNVATSPLYLRDVERVDKQDDRAAARLFSAEALDCLLLNFPEHRAMAVYLFVLGELINAWQNRHISHAKRIRMALRARYFLMVWHAHVDAHPDHRHDVHFISRESFDICLRLCDGLIELIVVYREFYPAYPLLPWLHSTEMLEHFFGVLRSLKKDFNFADALWLEPKLRTLMMGAFKDLAPEEQENVTAAGYWTTYHIAPDYNGKVLCNFPPNSVFDSQSQRAIRDVTMLCDAIGIEALEMLEAYKPPTYDDGATTTDRSHEPHTTLHNLLNGFPLISPASVVLEDAQDMAQYALDAQSTDATMEILDLSDSDPNELAELQTTIAQALQELGLSDTAVGSAQHVVHDLEGSSTDLNREALVAIRKSHQMRATSRAVCQLKASAGFTLAEVVEGQKSRARRKPKEGEASGNTPKESLRKQIVCKARAKGVAIQSGPGVTSGTGRIIRHTGVFVAEPDTSARAKQKQITQGVAAQEFVTTRTPFFSSLQVPGSVNVITANISADCPLVPGDWFLFLRPGRQDEPTPMLLGQVITMYTNSGTKGATHNYTPQISSVGAPSYVGAQVFTPAYGNVYQSIACPTLHATTFMHVPRTHIMLSLARDCALISTNPVTKGSRPLTLCYLGEWSNSKTWYLVSNADLYVGALREMLNPKKKEEPKKKGASAA